MPAALPRPILIARIHQLGRAIHALDVQAGYDGALSFTCMPAMQAELVALTATLADSDGRRVA